MLKQTLEVERSANRYQDTGLDSTYQLDRVRRDHGFRAMVVASREGEMLIGSMDEPIGKPLARAVAAVGLDAEDSEVEILELRNEYLNGDRDAELHVLGIELDGVPVQLGILASKGQEIGDAFDRTYDGLTRIFATT